MMIFAQLTLKNLWNDKHIKVGQVPQILVSFLIKWSFSGIPKKVTEFRPDVDCIK